MYQEHITSHSKIVLSDQELNITEAWSFVQDPECGATNLFTGATRNHHDGKTVTKLWYDCYESMAIKELSRLSENILEEFSISKIALYHRIGNAPISTVSLVVAISAAHRQAALDATSELIIRLKKDVPIWKREYFEDGGRWKEELE